MALGTQNSYNSNGSNKNQSNVNVYSPYKMSNTEGIDPSAINFTFCLNMLNYSKLLYLISIIIYYHLRRYILVIGNIY